MRQPAQVGSPWEALVGLQGELGLGLGRGAAIRVEGLLSQGWWGVMAVWREWYGVGWAAARRPCHPDS